METEIPLQRMQWKPSSIEDLFIDYSPEDITTVVDSQGLTPLSWAILYQRWDLAMKLLQHGVDPNYQSADGLTALHMVLITYSSNLHALPIFRSSYYYFYSNTISSLSCISDDDTTRPFLNTLVQFGAKLIPDVWMMTALTVARLSRLDNEVRLIEENLDVGVRDVLECSIIQALHQLNPFLFKSYDLYRQNISASIKHGIPISLSQSIIRQILQRNANLIEMHQFAFIILRQLYPFPSLPLKLFLNLHFTTLVLRSRSHLLSATDEVRIFDLFRSYLEMINTGYPTHFIEYFTNDALRVAAIELENIFDFTLILDKSLELHYTSTKDLSWVYPIDRTFNMNYIPLLMYDFLPSRSDVTNGEDFIYRLIQILSRIYFIVGEDSTNSELNIFFSKWISNLNFSVCRLQSLLSIVIVTFRSKCAQLNNWYRFAFRVIDFLLKFEVDINERARDTLACCLHTTVHLDMPEIFTFLLEKNAYLFTVDKRGLNALDMIRNKSSSFKIQLFMSIPKLRPPYPLKSLAAKAVSEYFSHSQLRVGHQRSQLSQLLELHLHY